MNTPNNKRSGILDRWSTALPLSNIPLLHPSTTPPRRLAFTLIEFIGVLAVLAILASVLTVAVIRRVDQGAWTRETADLTAIGDSYTQYILRNRYVPAYTNMASTIASQMSLSATSVATNSRRFARAFL